MREKLACKVCSKATIDNNKMSEDERKIFEGAKFWVCKDCIEEHKLCRGCLQEGIIKDRGDQDLQDNPPCKNHVDNKLYLLVLNFIKTRIADLGSEDKSRGQFVIRELVQNADDEKAQIVVLRFQKDALYVANDGKAFSGDDWSNIRQILGGHKETVKEKSGHFGSGFQTVYTFTNSPEVHSNDISARMNPIDGEVEIMGDKQERTSPYVKNKGNKGSLFLFPWRDDKEALKVIDGKTYFKDEQDWPRWNKTQMKKLFEDLTEYVHKVFLCCQHLRCVRLVWAVDGESRAYQVCKDFALHDTKYHLKIGTVESGHGTTSNDFTTSFQINDWAWDVDRHQYRYLIGSRRVMDERGEVHIVKIEEQHESRYLIQPSVMENQTEVKINLVHMLLPLFDCTELMTTEEREHSGSPYPLYSVIPLPTRSPNRFAFTGHFFPTQTRKDVDVAGQLGEWYRTSMANVMHLYRELFPRLVDEVISRDHPTAKDQATILNPIPVNDVTEWMRPGKSIDEAGQTWFKPFKGALEQLLFNKRIILDSDNGIWTRLEENYWCSEGKVDVVDVLKLRHLNDMVTVHPSFKTLHGPKLDGMKFNDEALFNEWSRMIKDESSRNGGVARYGTTISGGVRLDHDNMAKLITYCFRPGAINKLASLPLVPGEDKVLREVRSYPLLNKTYSGLEPLLPASLKVHKDFDDYTRSIEEGQRTKDAKETLGLISNIVELDPDSYTPMSQDKHKSISIVVARVVLDKGFALSPDLKGLNFIPYVLGGKVYLGPPNKNEDGLLIGKEVGGRHEGETQLRSSIFAPSVNKIDGLTPEVEAKIKFLAISGEGDIKKIMSGLHLVELQSNSKEPTNFVRHFLSPRHGSLFDDKNLSEFLGTKDKSVLEQQKRCFLDALKDYFYEGEKGKTETYLTRDHMAQVPCLYDSSGTWYPAGRFAYEMFAELDFGFKALHPDLKAWEQDSLLALGVRKTPDGRTIATAIIELINRGRPDLVQLANIFAYVLTTDVEEADALSELRTKEWVPVGKILVRPTAVILPSKKNIMAFGIQSGPLFDPSACSKDLADRLVRALEDGDVRNQEHFGYKTEPSLTDMLEAIVRKREANEEPNETIFEMVQERLGKEKADKPLVSHGYYIHTSEGEWVDSGRILLTDNLKRPGVEEMGIHILPSGHPHAKYLRWDGAETEPRGDVIMTMVAEGKLQPTLEIWDFLEHNKCIYGQTLTNRLAGSSIYPYDGKVLTPSSIVIVADQDYHPQGEMGNRYFIGGNGRVIHSSTLAGLGAKHIEGLTQMDVQDILAHVDGINPMKADEVENVLRLISATSLKLSSKTLEISWPCRFGDKVMMSPVTRSFITDEDEELTKELLQQEIPIPVLEINGQRKHELEKAALRSGARRISREDGLELKKALIRGKTLNERVTQGLKEFCSSTVPSAVLGGEREIFNRLGEITAYDVDDIRLRYDIGGVDLELKSDRSELTDIDGVLELLIIPEEAELQADRISKVLMTHLVNDGLKVDRKTVELLKLLIYDKLRGDLSPIIPFIPPYIDEPEPQDRESNRRYHEIRTRFSDMYGCCQICSRRTPTDENNTDTMEKIKSLVCKKGGMFPIGEPTRYTIGNSLFLCPTHHTLLARGLVRFPSLKPDSDPSRMIGELTSGIDKYESMSEDEEVPFVCEVFEGRLKDSTWTRCDSMLFKAGHLVEMLENFRSYYQRRLKDEE